MDESVIGDLGLGTRRSISMDDLIRLEEPAVIFEGEVIDRDGRKAYIYTVAGWLDGRNIATREGGCTVGGDVIVVTAKSRKEADTMAAEGLGDTIRLLTQEAYSRVMTAHGAGLADIMATARVLDQGPNAGIITTAEVRPKRRNTS